jgi:hypothetical protein
VVKHIRDSREEYTRTKPPETDSPVRLERNRNGQAKRNGPDLPRSHHLPRGAGVRPLTATVPDIDDLAGVKRMRSDDSGVMSLARSFLRGRNSHGELEEALYWDMIICRAADSGFPDLILPVSLRLFQL